MPTAPVSKGDGLRVRLKRVPGQTPRHVLPRQFAFPAVIGDFEYEEEAQFVEYDTIDTGEFSQPLAGDGYHGRKLKRFELQVLALDFDPSWITHAGYDWWNVRSRLFAILHSKRPFHFAARTYRGEDAPYELRGTYTVRRVGVVLRHGERDTRYFNVSFAEWRDATMRARPRDPGRGGKAQLPRKHKLKDDDTLKQLSKRFYGTYEHWRLLGDRNGIGKWGGEDPIIGTRKFKVGDKFLIPKKPEG